MAIIFDFDKTLTKLDSITLFTFFIWRRKYVDILVIVKLLFLSLKYAFKMLDNTDFKSSYFRSLKVHRNEINLWFDEYFESHLFKGNLNMSAIFLSLTNDDNIVVVTASPAYYVSKVFPHIRVIGGELLFDKSGLCCGYQNCFGDSKSTILLSKNINVDYVFTDSKSDMPLIKICKKEAFLVKKGFVKKVYAR